MSWVTIAGIDMAVCDGTWQEEEAEYIGVFRHVANGDGMNNQRSPKRGFTCTVFFLTAELLDAFRLATSETDNLGVPTRVPVTSPADGGTRGVTLTCYCWMGRAQAVSYWASSVKTAYWKVALTLREA